MRMEIFLYQNQSNKKGIVKVNRYQTNGMASKDIKAPRIAVKPHIKIRECRM